MRSATKHFPSLHLIITAAATVLFCAAAVSAIVAWAPGTSWLPADNVAVQE
ncbi:hypothetical protein ACFQAT_11470 [Undibacterium arcticum]|uniref:hypothetical protein n=1 Tax=Undibacterium arcticum TaxID=1762892 RepID=UPI00360954EE